MEVPKVFVPNLFHPRKQPLHPKKTFFQLVFLSLYNYSLSKYGDSLNSNRFFETTEVKDSSGRLILPKGKVVDSNFTIPKPGEPTATLNPVVGISNYEYETRLNDEKRNIFILREDYIQEFLEDMRAIMTYDESSEFINGKTIKSENTNITLP